MKPSNDIELSTVKDIAGNPEEEIEVTEKLTAPETNPVEEEMDGNTKKAQTYAHNRRNTYGITLKFFNINAVCKNKHSTQLLTFV